MKRASAQAAVTASASRTSTGMRSTSRPSQVPLVAPGLDERHDVSAARQESSYHGRTDEPGGPRDHDPIPLGQGDLIGRSNSTSVEAGLTSRSAAPTEDWWRPNLSGRRPVAVAVASVAVAVAVRPFPL